MFILLTVRLREFLYQNQLANRGWHVSSSTIVMTTDLLICCLYFLVFEIHVMSKSISQFLKPLSNPTLYLSIQIWRRDDRPCLYCRLGIKSIEKMYTAKETFGTKENAQLAEWLEEVLKVYIRNLAIRKTILSSGSKSRLNKTSEASTSSQSEGVAEDEQNGDDDLNSSDSDEDGNPRGGLANDIQDNTFFVIRSIKFEKVEKGILNEFKDDALRVDIEYWVSDISQGSRRS